MGELRRHLFAQQPDRVHHTLVRNAPAAVQFGEDPVEPQLLLYAAQPRGKALGGSADHLDAQRVLAGQTAQPLGPSDALLAAGPPGRLAESTARSAWRW